MTPQLTCWGQQLIKAVLLANLGAWFNDATAQTVSRQFTARPGTTTVQSNLNSHVFLNAYVNAYAVHQQTSPPPCTRSCKRQLTGLRHKHCIRHCTTHHHVAMHVQCMVSLHVHCCSMLVHCILHHEMAPSIIDFGICNACHVERFNAYSMHTQCSTPPQCSRDYQSAQWVFVVAPCNAPQMASAVVHGHQPASLVREFNSC
jgi:hypothetical protein